MEIERGRAGIPDGHRCPPGSTVDLQPNFALNQPLSPFALAAVELLDPLRHRPRKPMRSTW